MACRICCVKLRNLFLLLTLIASGWVWTSSPRTAAGDDDVVAPVAVRLSPATVEDATAVDAPAIPEELFSDADDEAEPVDAAAELRELRRRVEQLEAAAERSRPAGDRPAPETGAIEQLAGEQPADKKSGGAAAGADGKAGTKDKADEWLDVSGEKWDVKLGGHVQMDFITWAHADPAIQGDQNYFEFRRLRLAADGKGYGVYDFRLQLTLEPESLIDQTSATPEVKDAYFSINEIPLLGRFRVGNFFVPFSLEQVTNDTNNIFLERSIPVQGVFGADREVGMAFYNCTEDRRVTWSSGVFLDSISESIKERIDDNQGLRMAGRVTALPYYDEPSNGRYLVHVGAGILHTEDQDGRVRIRTRPQIHEGPRLIDSGVVDAARYTNGNLEFAAVMGQFTLQSEMFLSRVDRTRADAALVYGSYIHGSWFLTGENRIFEPFGQHGAQFARNSPYSNVFFTPGGAGLGAWEVKARWSWLGLDRLQAGQYNDVTVGFNWYWSDRVRLMFDYIHPITSSQTVFGSTTSDILAMRFDFNW